MDDIKRPPKLNSNGNDNGVDFPSRVSGPVSQTSSSITPKVPNRNGPLITPINSDQPKAPSGPISLDDLNIAPTASQKFDEINESGIESSSAPESNSLAINLEDLDSSPHIYDPSKPSETTEAQPQTETQDETTAIFTADGTSDSLPEKVADSNSDSSDRQTQAEVSGLNATPAQPELDAVSNDDSATSLSPTAPNLTNESDPSKASLDSSLNNIETNAGKIATTETPQLPDLSDDKKGKVSLAPTGSPKKKKFSWMAVLVAFLLALSLAAGAGYAYYQKDQQENKNTVSQPVQPEAPKADVLKAEDFDSTDQSLDKIINDVKTTDEAVNSDLTDTGLGL